MDRADDGLVQVSAVAGKVVTREHLAAHALAHLRCSGVGEGDGGDLWDTALAQELDVALDEHARLSAARASGDEDIAPTGINDRLLFGGQLLRSHVHRLPRLNSLTRQTCLNAQ